jgi:hypothetical protein
LKEKRDPNKPFSLNLWHKAVHEDHLPAPRHNEMYAKEALPVPPYNTHLENFKGKPEWQRIKSWDSDWKNYIPSDSIAPKPWPIKGDKFKKLLETLISVDESLGRVLAALEELGELSYFIKIAGQVFDNLVQYNIWSKSNYEVEELTEWFEEYMDSYRGMFREAGIVQTVFNRRIRDDTLVAMKNGYHVRSVLYYVRTERVHVENISPIQRIDLKINVNDLRSLKDNISDQIIDANLYELILNKWHK